MDSLKFSALILIALTVIPVGLNTDITQTESRYSELPWNLQQINIEDAWDRTTGSTEIIIAVIDTGIDFSHPALSHTQWFNTDEIVNNSVDDDNNGYIDDYEGWDWINQDNNPGWQVGDEIHHHGTFIAGIVAANDSEVLGVAPKVKIMSLRVVDKNSLISNPAGLEEAVEYAIQKNVSAITMSLDLVIGPPGFRDSIRSAISANIPVIGVAGNSDEGNGSIVLPGRYSEVIAVGASNSNGEKADYSNTGEELEILAPGGQRLSHQLQSTTINGAYLYDIGTSYAAPHVAGVVGLIKSIRFNFTVEDIRYILHSTAHDIGSTGWDIESGFGILNASAAVEFALTYEGTDTSTTTSSRPPGLFGIVSISFYEIIIFLTLLLPLLRKKRG
jgi:subtilisin family serine protease